MRKIFLYQVLAVFGLMLTVSCTGEDVSELAGSAQDGTVQFQPESAGTTRASDTSFDTGDAIGVFASTKADGSLSATGNYASNAKYLYSSGRFINAGVGIEVPKTKASEVHYYAAYPYQENASAKYNFTIREDQSTFDGYTKSDLCLADTIAGGNEALVPLKFDHVMSRVLIDASGAGLYPGTYRVELLAYKHTVSVDLERQTVESLPSSQALPVKMCEDGSNHFKAILPPQTLSTVDVVGRLYIGNEPSKSIQISNNIELPSGTSIELKLLKNSYGYYFDYGGTGDSSIPGDDDANPNPNIGDPTTTIPNIQYVCEVVGSDIIVRLDMTGIQDPTTLDWIRLYGTNNPDQNIWISVDDRPKGFTVYNNVDEADGGIKTDVIFIVDNSGSMSEEANAVARDIISWSQTLVNSGLDVRFACVGYSVSGTINGGIDFTNGTGLATFLNRSSGTGRTMGFSGSNASALQTAASAYRVSDECGAMAIRYANANLSFRSGANRIYVNFTDEPNQPNGRQDYSVEFFASQQNWGTSLGTVHTVYSGYSFTERLYYQEFPWKISEYTGGTVFKTDSSFSGVDLNSLPITGALQNSYVIRFHNVSYLVGDGRSHLLKITVLSRDRRVRAERVYNVTFVLDGSSTR